MIATLSIMAFLLTSAIPQAVEAKFWDWNIKDLVFNNSTSTETEVDLIVEETELPMKDWVLKQVAEAGLNPAEAEVIINCESRWESDAMGVNNNRSVDLGLWQINSIHKDISNADKLDYKMATSWAIQKRIKDGHWRAWSCSRKLASR